MPGSCQRAEARFESGQPETARHSGAAWCAAARSRQGSWAASRARCRLAAAPAVPQERVVRAVREFPAGARGGAPRAIEHASDPLRVGRAPRLGVRAAPEREPLPAAASWAENADGAAPHHARERRARAERRGAPAPFRAAVRALAQGPGRAGVPAHALAAAHRGAPGRAAARHLSVPGAQGAPGAGLLRAAGRRQDRAVGRPARLQVVGRRAPRHEDAHRAPRRAVRAGALVRAAPRAGREPARVRAPPGRRVHLLAPAQTARWGPRPQAIVAAAGREGSAG